MESASGRREILILVDHNIEGQAALLFRTLNSTGWLKLQPIRMLTFQEVGLAATSNDRVVWRFAQQHDMFLLTDNRRMLDDEALERTIQEEGTPTSLPVLTVGSRDRMNSRIYREDCATRIMEIIIDLDNYLGVGRLYIP